MGGTTASLAALDIKRNFPDYEIQLLTLEQPRLGNLEFALYIKSMLPNSYRITH